MEPGFYQMPFAEYRRFDGVNWSSLKHLRESALSYRWHADQPETEPSAAMLIGSAAHTLILEPDRLPLDLAVWEDGDRRGNAWKEFKAANVGKTIVKPDEYERIKGMRNAVMNNPDCADLLTGEGANEVAAVWIDEATGMRCKARLDRYSKARGIIDIKTTASIDARKFCALAARFGYHNQLAHYRAGVADITGEWPASIQVRIIAVEQQPPHDATVYVLTDDQLLPGEDENRELMARLAECTESNVWPGRYDEPQVLELPAWIYPDVDDEMTFGGE